MRHKICIHNKQKRRCVDCKGSEMCIHNKRKYRCIICDFEKYFKERIFKRIRFELRKHNIEFVDTTEELFQIFGLSDMMKYKEFIENKFTEKMTWDNYGNYWEIDHIIPITYQVNRETITKEEILHRLHYTNTQPLPKIDNLKKGNKYIYDITLNNNNTINLNINLNSNHPIKQLTLKDFFKKPEKKEEKKEKNKEEENKTK